MKFDLHIGIDYSGRETPTSRTPALQVYAAFDTEEPRRILSPSSTEKTYKNWNRKVTSSVTSSNRGPSSSTTFAITGLPTKSTRTLISSVIAREARQTVLDRTTTSGWRRSGHHRPSPYSSLTFKALLPSPRTLGFPGSGRSEMRSVTRFISGRSTVGMRPRARR